MAGTRRAVTVDVPAVRRKPGPRVRDPRRNAPVDTSAVEARIRAEIEEAIGFGRWHETHKTGEAEWWRLYVASLFGLLADRWALMTIVLGEMEHD